MKLNSMFTGVLKGKKPKLLGRGIGCGKGKTSGRGHKGQKARSGVSINGFEGGQQSIYTRLPKRGFKSKCKDVYSIINLVDIQHLINVGKVSQGDIIDKDLLYKYKLIKSTNCKVKLLNNGKLSESFAFYVNSVSSSAKKSVISAGGSIEILL
ncbi:50S ribosomal protein L15 [Wolbachia endosymbiont of Pentidionis agamae]|uniref:50S ribosomal protein L15 n=1 Tax=Wolbachia endosymbiont of Pentidionis agamae TaxID=3110435 RepID=UPI002FCF89EB